MNFPTLSNTIKGLIIIAAGTMVLLDSFGIAPQIMHSIVLVGAIVAIIWGIILANIHSGVYRLIAKGAQKKEPVASQTSYSHEPKEHDDFKM